MIHLIFGMIRNVQGIYRAPSDYLLNVRKRVSDAVKRFLMCRYGSGLHDSVLGCMAAIVVYRPLLAAFLTERLCIDVLTPRAFEVSDNIHLCLRLTSDRGLRFHGPYLALFGEHSSCGIQAHYSNEKISNGVSDKSWLSRS